MSGLKISELNQPTLSADKNIRINDLLPIARTSLTGEDTFALPGAAFVNNVVSIGTGNTLLGAKTFDVNSGNSQLLKSLSAIAPIVLVDNGSTISLNLSGTITNAIAGLTPIKTTIYGNGVSKFFALPNVPLPEDPSAFRVDINGVLQEPSIDYTILYNTSPFQISFTTAPADGEKVVIVAFAPGATSTYTAPILQSNGVLANTTNGETTGTTLRINSNQVLGNTTFNSIGLSGISIANNNEFLGNIGSGIQAVNLSNWKTVTTNYTILSSDFSSTIAVNSTSPLTVTIPNNNFNTGFQFTVIRLGSGTVSFSPVAGAPGTPSGTGVILNQAYGLNQLASRWSAVTVIYSGNPSTGWVVFGDLA